MKTTHSPVTTTADEDTDMLVEEVTPDVASCGGWWDSGDARELFAPRNLLYDANCNVKAIVLERIEILESVNHLAANWMNVTETMCTSSVKTAITRNVMSSSLDLKVCM